MIVLFFKFCVVLFLHKYICIVYNYWCYIGIEYYILVKWVFIKKTLLMGILFFDFPLNVILYYKMILISILCIFICINIQIVIIFKIYEIHWNSSLFLIFSSFHLKEMDIINTNYLWQKYFEYLPEKIYEEVLNHLQSSHKKLIHLKILILNSHILIIEDKKNKNNLKS